MLVLVVDDDELIRQALTALLRSSHGVQCAGSAEEALGLLEAGTRPDLILVDDRLDEMSGLEFRAALAQHSHWASIPTVLMTAAELPGDLSALGFTAGLSKPFSSAELLPILSRLRVD